MIRVEVYFYKSFSSILGGSYDGHPISCNVNPSYWAEEYVIHTCSKFSSDGWYVAKFSDRKKYLVFEIRNHRVEEKFRSTIEYDEQNRELEPGEIEAEKAEKKIDWDEIDFRNEIDAERDADTIIQEEIDASYNPLQDPNSKYFERR